jgi:hypothetical protein
MRDVAAQRTLVKSVPELWAELSETSLLDRVLHESFGEIRITRLAPESSIDWESDLAAGSVELQPSVFGTRVRLTAQLPAEPEPQLPPRPGLLARLFSRLRPPASPSPAELQPEPVLDAAAAQLALTSVLDHVGAARHRPFSRQPAR